MQVKASLHIHTAEDKIEGKTIRYSIYKLLDRAKRLDFKIIALTCHNYFVYKKEHGDYAKQLGLLLIPGIEASIFDTDGSENHVIILNCQKDAETIVNFVDLENYKKIHPEVFIFAPHPNFGFGLSIGLKKLVEHIDLFDAIEHSWFYTRWVNLNKKTEVIAKQYNKPFIAAADLHGFNYRFFRTDYILVNLSKLTPEALFSAIKNRNFINFTKPKSIFSLSLASIRGLINSFFLEKK